MWLDKIESEYKKYETQIKAITGVGIGLVVGMYFYGKYKANKISKVVDKVVDIQREAEDGE
jgi:hypothetical protein